jgi:hypothetical protein
MSARFTCENHYRVARELEAQKVAGSELDASTLLFSAARYDSEPARFFAAQAALLTTRFVSVKLYQRVGVAFALPALQDHILIE